MNRLYLAICILLLSVLAGGCSYRANNKDNVSANQHTSQPQAWLQPGVLVTLPAPGISPPVNVQQLLTGTVDGKQHSLLVLLNADQQGITLAGLSPLGIRLFLLRYDASGIHSEQHIPVVKLPPPSQVLADIMLTHWPIAAWQPQLPPGWTLRDIGDQRQLRNASGKLITDIHYLTRNGQRQPIAITQHAFHYHIAIHYSGS